MTTNPLPRGARILIVGAADARNVKDIKSAKDRNKLGGETLRFARILGQELACGDHEVPVVAITGGRDFGWSVDSEFVAGVKEKINAEEIRNRLITFPYPNKPLPECFKGTYIVQSRSQNFRVRRLEMVQIADAAISLGGSAGSRDTHLMVEAVGVPVLPLPFTGGTSRKVWEHKDNKERWDEFFGETLMQIVDNLDLLTSPSDDDLRDVAKAIVNRVREIAVLPCFVMMPYRDPAVDWIYQDVVLQAIEDAGMTPIRSDETLEPGRIIEQMLDQIRSSAVCVAVLSDRRGINPNVMYELGFAHALDIPSIILAESAKDLAFDVRVERTIEYGSYEAINEGSKLEKRAELRDMLREARKARLMSKAT